MEVKVAIAVQIMFLVTLLYSIFRISVTGKMTTFTKWMIAGSYIGVLAFADRVKLITGILFIAIVMVTKYLTDKKKHIETGSNRLDS